MFTVKWKKGLQQLYLNESDDEKKSSSGESRSNSPEIVDPQKKKIGGKKQ